MAMGSRDPGGSWGDRDKTDSKRLTESVEQDRERERDRERDQETETKKYRDRQGGSQSTPPYRQ